VSAAISKIVATAVAAEALEAAVSRSARGFLLLLVLSFIFKRDLIRRFQFRQPALPGVSLLASCAQRGRVARSPVRFFVLDDAQSDWDKLIPTTPRQAGSLRDQTNSPCGRLHSH
jgi:hypothetical protein